MVDVLSANKARWLVTRAVAMITGDEKQKKAAPASLARDLGALLPRGPPRTFGAAPAHPGKFRRLAPSPLHDAVRRVKRAVCRS